MKLTDEILLNTERREKIYKLYDGAGLSIEVPPRGNLRWRYKFSFGGKEKRLSVGLYPETSIEVARAKRDVLKSQSRDGVDPAVFRRESKNRMPTSKYARMTREQLINRLSEVEDIIRYTRITLLKARDYLEKEELDK